MLAGSKRGQNPKWVQKRGLPEDLETRKKPDFSGFLDGSGDWIRTNDRSGMNDWAGTSKKLKECLKKLDN